MKDDIERYLRTGVGDFERLSLELFAYQFQRNGSYRAFCEVQGVTPDSVRKWQDIPAVPIEAFKSSELATFPVGQAAAIFESSATTTGTPSRHYIRDLRFYETAIKTSFGRFMELPAQGSDASEQRSLAKRQPPFLILTPSPAEAPHSSLSWMMEVVKRTWGGSGSDYFVQRGLLDEPRLVRALRKMEKDGIPILLLGTTIAFLAFYDYSARNNLNFRLSSGSRIMDTGGMKTQKRKITRVDFVDRSIKVFGVPELACMNEYGMCELGSQFYGRGKSTLLEGPPWTRTLVIDPLTGQKVAPGQQGVLSHFDLSNVDSVMAIQTEDRGIALPGEAAFEFLGRAPDASLKGCSLAAENHLR